MNVNFDKTVIRKKHKKILLGKAILCVQPFNPPIWPHKNRPGAWNTSLLNDKESIECILCLSPRVGLSLFQAQCVLLRSARIYVCISDLRHTSGFQHFRLHQ